VYLAVQPDTRRRMTSCCVVERPLLFGRFCFFRMHCLHLNGRDRVTASARRRNAKRLAPNLPACLPGLSESTEGQRVSFIGNTANCQLPQVGRDGLNFCKHIFCKASRVCSFGNGVRRTPFAAVWTQQQAATPRQNLASRLGHGRVVDVRYLMLSVGRRRNQAAEMADQARSAPPARPRQPNAIAPATFT
jgi:hypothetical protein